LVHDAAVEPLLFDGRAPVGQLDVEAMHTHNTTANVSVARRWLAGVAGRRGAPRALRLQRRAGRSPRDAGERRARTSL